MIYHDAYYKKQDNLTYEERTKINYDHPNALDTNILIEDVKKLKKWKKINKPVYSFTNHNRENCTVDVNPAKIVILEGILVLENKELRDLMDIKIFVDTDADVRILRRLERDISERRKRIKFYNNSVLQYSKTNARAIC